MSLATLVPRTDVDEITIMYKLDITFAQACILRTMWKNGSIGINQTPIVRSTRQHIYKMRPKLAKLGIYIVTVGAGHYGMPQKSRDILDRMF